MDDFSKWSRPIPGQERELVSSYDFDELRDNDQRQQTALKHAHEIGLWLWGWWLFSEAYPALGHRTYSSSSGSVYSTENQHYWTRQSLLMLTGRAMKPALDLLLSCYYTEAWSLLRTSLDGWASAVFVRLQPEEYVRWVEAADGDENDEQVTSTTKGPNWRTIEEIICEHGDEDDRTAFDAAHLRWRILHLGVHPSGTGLSLTHDPDLRIMTFRPEYAPTLCTVTPSLGVFVQRMLLDEVARMDAHSDDWLFAFSGFLDHTMSLIGCIKASLDREANELEESRRSNWKQLISCVKRRWLEEHPESS